MAGAGRAEPKAQLAVVTVARPTAMGNQSWLFQMNGKVSSRYVVVPVRDMARVTDEPPEGADDEQRNHLPQVQTHAATLPAPESASFCAVRDALANAHNLR